MLRARINSYFDFSNFYLRQFHLKFRYLSNVSVSKYSQQQIHSDLRTWQTLHLQHMISLTAACDLYFGLEHAAHRSCLNIV